MTKTKIALGLNPCEDWSEEDLDQYDEGASRERYADLCCDAIQAMNPDIDIEELYPYQHSPQILNWKELSPDAPSSQIPGEDEGPDFEEICQGIDEVPDLEEICQDIDEICSSIYFEFEWLLEKI